MTYRERLIPSGWIYAAAAFLVPACLLVFAPINIGVGIVAAIVLYGGSIGALVLTAPVIEVDRGELRAGSARLPLGHVGTAEALRGTDATRARGVELDARAWLVIRGWVQPVVRIEVTDPEDPSPYWLVSSRRPEELVAALESQRAATRG
ncbi:MAG: hypothetical protein JWP66_1514 [Naasia sp.]|nr:hypothetical protein [Naasia sp.]